MFLYCFCSKTWRFQYLICLIAKEIITCLKSRCVKVGDDKISDVYQSKTQTERDKIKESYRVSSVLPVTHFSPVLRFI